jgi:hypothetical protein
LTPYHGTEGKSRFATRQAKEKDHDEDRKRQARLHLQDRRLPLQSLQLHELRLLNGTGRVREGAARFRVVISGWADESSAAVGIADIAAVPLPAVAQQSIGAECRPTNSF